MIGLQKKKKKAETTEMAQAALFFFVSSSSRGPIKGSHILGMNGPGDKSISPSSVIDL